MALVGAPKVWTVGNYRTQNVVDQPALLGIDDLTVEVLSWGISFWSNAPGHAHVGLASVNLADQFSRKPSSTVWHDNDETVVVTLAAAGVNGSDFYGGSGQTGLLESHFVRLYGGSLVRDYLPGKGPKITNATIFMINNPGAMFSYTAWITASGLKT